MKWAVGPRRIGKSTVAYKLLLQSAMLNPGQTLYHVSPTRVMAKFAFEEFVKTIKQTAEIDRSALTLNVIFSDKITTLKFIGHNDIKDRGFESKPKVIDNADMILQNMFGRIDLATGTGPNYKFKDLSKKFQEIFKEQGLPEDNIDTKWKLDETD